MNSTSNRAPQAVLVLTGPPSANLLPARAKARVRILEVRLDLFAQDLWPSLPREIRRAFPNAKLLATLRLDRDGGRWPDASSRLDALRRILDLHRWDFVDVEDDSPERESMLALVRESNAGIVLSRHAFIPQSAEEVADAIPRLFQAAISEKAVVAKWAVRLDDLDGTLPGLLRQISSPSQESPIPAIFPMGARSETGRVAAALTSGGWGYAHDGSGPAAPGQIAWPIFEALLGSLPPPGDDARAWLSSVGRAVDLAISPENAA